VPVEAADVLLVESTYGDRLHGPEESARLAAIITDTAARGGKLIVPSFAIGRTEEVIYWIKKLEEQKRIPILPVYVDSPMAAGALQFYTERMNELDPDLNHGGEGQREVCAFCTARMTVVETVEQSKAIMRSPESAIVIAASGMATGGRVLHHLIATLPDSRNTVMFVGFQAAGTRGRTLCDGAKQIKMLGQIIAVNAKIEQLDSMSAHADAGEILRWLKGFKAPPQMTFIVHGEPSAAESLQKKIQAELNWPTHIAKYLERVDIS
jgi:metallo-beta-lactamase family protein